jgi:hypothetical protein
MNKSTRLLLIKSLWFQLIWLLAVIGRNNWQDLLALLILATLLMDNHLLRNKFPILLLLLPGLLMDFLFFNLGIFVFIQGDYFPLWLALLWVAFTWYFLQIAAFLATLPIALQALLGGVAGTTSYWAGVVLNAVQWPMGWITFVILFVWWTTLIPFLIHAHKAMNKRLASS